MIKFVVENNSERFEVEGWDVELTLTELLRKAGLIEESDNIKVLSDKEVHIIEHCG